MFLIDGGIPFLQIESHPHRPPASPQTGSRGMGQEGSDSIACGFNSGAVRVEIPGTGALGDPASSPTPELGDRRNHV